MAKFTPVHYSRVQQPARNEWQESYAGAPVELDAQTADSLNKQFETTGVKYVPAEEGTAVKTSLLGNGPSMPLPPAASAPAMKVSPDFFLRKDGVVVTGEPVTGAVISAALLEAFQWPTGIEEGDTVNVAASGYVYVVKSEAGSPNPNKPADPTNTTAHGLLNKALTATAPAAAAIPAATEPGAEEHVEESPAPGSETETEK